MFKFGFSCSFSNDSEGSLSYSIYVNVLIFSGVHRLSRVFRWFLAYLEVLARELQHEVLEIKFAELIRVFLVLLLLPFPLFPRLFGPLVFGRFGDLMP